MTAVELKKELEDVDDNAEIIFVSDNYSGVDDYKITGIDFEIGNDFSVWQVRLLGGER